MRWLFALLLLAACNENPVGRACFIGEGVAKETTAVSTPALECQSRMCLHRSGFDVDMCTGECSSDDDCDAVAETPCQGGFVCAIPTTTGDFCCKKMCICADQIDVPEGGQVRPAACDPENPDNECPNLR
jgi:hypothetical protein